MQRYKFGFDGCYVSIDQFSKQDGLIRAQLFAALGKLEGKRSMNPTFKALS